MANKVNRLTDVEVQKVGLVSLGANQERFFLLKSVQEDVMPEDQVTAPDTDQILDDESWIEKLKTRLGLNKQDEAVAEEPEAEVEVGAESEGEVEAEAEPEVEPEVEVEQPADEPIAEEEVEKRDEQPETIEKVDALEKANRELSERLEKAEAMLAEQQERAARAEFVEKVDALRCVPVEKSALVDRLHQLYKADSDLYGFFYGVLSAMDKALADAGLFIETGTTEVEEKDTDAVIQKAIASGNADELAKALFALPKDEANAIIEARRKKTGRR